MHTQAEQLAEEFSRTLRKQLTADEMAEVIARNEEDANPSVCHSHDFCDANMAMHEAGVKLKFWTDDANVNTFADLWNEAWDIAKSRHFRLPLTKLDSVQGLGWGVTRIGVRNVGYADVSAVFTNRTQGWNVEVQQTNVHDSRLLDEMVAAFRKMEGLD